MATFSFWQELLPKIQGSIQGKIHSVLVRLTDFTPLRSNAIVEAEVVDLAVTLFYVQLSKAKVDPAATGNTDLPLTHCVVWVCPRVTQRGQSPTAGAKYARATAITCRTTQTEIEGRSRMQATKNTNWKYRG